VVYYLALYLFLQISDNSHKKMLSPAPASSRFKIFYQSEEGRDSAIEELEEVMKQMVRFAAEAKEQYDNFREGLCELSEEEQEEMHEKMRMAIDDPRLVKVDRFDDVKGIELPERLWKEAYVNRKDLTPMDGWETGRKSAPAFSNMNLHAIRDSVKAAEDGDDKFPHVALYQFDTANPMNPSGLLLAYEEEAVKPVVSDFDAFLIGCSGSKFVDPIPQDQLDLVSWSIQNLSKVLDKPGIHPFSTRWLQVLKKAGEEGFHPELPKYGFGDPTTVQLFADLVKVTSSSGAVRHGAECFNFYFPQELDDEYMVIMEGVDHAKPWRYLKEPELRQFLLDRINDGFYFPLNPTWPLRDRGWWEVWEALTCSPQAQEALETWYPLRTGIRQAMNDIHAIHPEGFVQFKKDAAHLHEHHFDDKDHQEMKTISHDIEHMGLSVCEMADLGRHEMRRHQKLWHAKRQLRIMLFCVALFMKKIK